MALPLLTPNDVAELSQISRVGADPQQSRTRACTA